MKLIEEIESLIEEGKELKPHGGDLFSGYNGSKQSEYVSWRLQVFDILNEMGDKGKPLIQEIKNDNNSAYFYKSSAENILGVLKGALALTNKRKVDKEKVKNRSTIKNSVFIVHGRDETLLQQTARFIEKLDVDPIILFEQPGKGYTIIEKLEEYSNVNFAIILFTPDDVGKLANEEDFKPRARQNVVLELGFFIGKIGRSNVAVIYDESIEMPSDYRGVEYIKIDPEGAWKLSLAKEIKESGIKIDMNKII